MKKFNFIFISILLICSATVISQDYDRPLFDSELSDDEFDKQEDLFIKNEIEYINRINKTWIFSDPNELYTVFTKNLKSNNSVKDFFPPSIITWLSETAFGGYSDSKIIAQALDLIHTQDFFISELYKMGMGYQFYILDLNLRSTEYHPFQKYPGFLFDISLIPTPNNIGSQNYYLIDYVLFFQPDYSQEIVNEFIIKPRFDNSGLTNSSNRRIYGVQDEISLAHVKDVILNLRDSPSLSGNIVAKLKPNELVLIHSKSTETMVINSYDDYWYQIETSSGINGWCYGAFLVDIEKY